MAFIQAYNALLGNRSYSESGIVFTNDFTCLYLDPDFPYCDERSGANSCYRTIGTFDQDDVEKALWYAYALVPTTINDSDLIAYYFNLYLYSEYGSTSLFWSVVRGFESHNICAAMSQYCQ